MAGFGTQPFGSSQFGGTNPGGAASSRVLARDTIVSRKRVGRSVTSRATAADTLTVRHRAVRNLATSPKVRDTAAGSVRSRAGATVASTVAVRDTVSAGTPRTRLYLPSSGAAAVSPAYHAEWDDTTNAASRTRATAEASATPLVTLTVAETGGSATNNRDLLVRQYVTDEIAAQTITGTIRGQVQARETDNAANMRGQAVVRVVSGDGTVERGVLYPGDLRTALVAEWSTTLRSQRVPANGSFPPFDVTPVACQSGDRLVVELGARAANADTGNFSAVMRLGDAGTGDLATGGGETILTLNPWFELSHVVAWLLPGVAQSRVTVADTAAGETTRAAAVADVVTVSDVVTGRALRARNVSSLVKALDTLTSKKRALRALATSPKVRDTVMGRSDRAGTVASVPKVRDTVTGRRKTGGSAADVVTVSDVVTGRSRRVGPAIADAVIVADTATGRRENGGAATSTVTVADTVAARKRGAAALASRVTVATSQGQEPESHREGPAVASAVTVSDSAAGGPRGARDVLTRVKVLDTVTGSAQLGGAVSTVVAVADTVEAASRPRVGGDVTSRVTVGDTIVVAAEFYRDITATARLLTSDVYRGSIEFVTVRITADVTLDDQPIEFQVARYKSRASSSGRRVVTLNPAAWEPAEWVGPAGVQRDAQVLFDAEGRGNRPGLYAVHARLTDNPERLVFINVGVVRIT